MQTVVRAAGSPNIALRHHYGIVRQMMPVIIGITNPWPIDVDKTKCEEDH